MIRDQDDSLENPPALDKGKCFEIYRKEILAW